MDKPLGEEGHRIVVQMGNVASLLLLQHIQKSTVQEEGLPHGKELAHFGDIDFLFWLQVLLFFILFLFLLLFFVVSVIIIVGWVTAQLYRMYTYNYNQFIDSYHLKS